MAKKQRKIQTDAAIHYLIPLCPLGRPYDTELREVEIFPQSGGMIKCRPIEDADKFEVHYFQDEYFQWLIRTNYIIPIEE